MILFFIGLFVGCVLGIFLTSLLAKSKEADEAWSPGFRPGLKG